MERVSIILGMTQQYEQRAKGIKKAVGTNLLALAQTLGCRVEKLRECGTEEIEGKEEIYI